MDRRLLILAHPFPPAGGGGVQRTSKLVKYLPRYGWGITVLTTQADLYSRLYGLEDQSLLEDVPPSVGVVRVPSPEIFDCVRPLPIRPDRARLWNFVAGPIAAALHAARQFDAIYALGNPFSTFLFARSLSKLIRRPYVLDFHDAWTLREVMPRRRERETPYELLALEGASQIVYATGAMLEKYAAAYPGLGARANAVINGFDASDFPVIENPEPRGQNDPIVLRHVGTLTAHVRPDTLLAGLALARSRGGAALRVRLELVGSDSMPLDTPIRIASHGLGGCVGLLGYRPHREALLLARSADALVLLTAGESDEQHAKTSEYIAAQRPILGCVRRGTPADALLDWAEAVERCPPNDVSGTAAAIERIAGQADARRAPRLLPTTPNDFAPLTREDAAQRYDAILSRAIELGNP